MKRLLHCPWCGEEEAVRPFDKTAEGIRAYDYCIVCDGCGCRGPVETSLRKDVALDAAIDRWNNRLPHDEDLALRTAFTLA